MRSTAAPCSWGQTFVIRCCSKKLGLAAWLAPLPTLCSVLAKPMCSSSQNKTPVALWPLQRKISELQRLIATFTGDATAAWLR